jgi:hypothetical protein
VRGTMLDLSAAGLESSSNGASDAIGTAGGRLAREPVTIP